MQALSLKQSNNDRGTERMCPHTFEGLKQSRHGGLSHDLNLT